MRLTMRGRIGKITALSVEAARGSAALPTVDAKARMLTSTGGGTNACWTDGTGCSLSKTEDSEGNVERDPGEGVLRPVATTLTSARAKLVLGRDWPLASLASACRKGGTELASFAHAGGDGVDACDRARSCPGNRDRSDLMLLGSAG